MKKFFVLVSVLAIIFGLISIKAPKAQAGYFHSQQLAQACDTQDPDSPCFAPGETADTCDTQDPDSPCFAPGEKADTPTPADYSTATPKSTLTVTPTPEPSYPSEEDILNMTRDNDPDGVGLLGVFLLSPIVSMIFSVVGFLIFIGVIILIVVLLRRRSNKKEEKSEDK